MAIRIIQAGLNNVAAIATIGKKSFRYAFQEDFTNKQDLFDYLEYTYDLIKISNSIRKENNVFLLAFVNDEPVAFTKLKKISRNKHLDVERQTELQKVYVLPGHQGAGIGSLLLSEAKSLAREWNSRYLWLDTAITNTKAIRVYESNGFVRIGKHHFAIGQQVFEYHVMAYEVAPLTEGISNAKTQTINQE